MDDEVGFVGLGVMGSAMAANVVAARPLVVWNRTPAAAHRMGQAGARVAATSTEVFRRCRTVVLMLADESALDAVLRDARPPLADRTVVQMGTVAPDWSRRLADHVRAAGGRYVEAPVSGSRRPAETGRLVALVAADDDGAVEEVTPLLATMCSDVVPCGAPPSALRVKLAVNAFLITLVAGLAESFHLAERSGVDSALLASVLAAGPMSSAVSRAKAEMLVIGDRSVHAAIADVLKNSRLVLAEAARTRTAAPLTALGERLFAETEQLGHAGDDMVAVIEAYRRRTAVGGEPLLHPHGTEEPA